MIEQVAQLEQHVDTLLTLLESAKLKIGELNRENNDLKQQVNQLDENLLERTMQLEAATEQNEKLTAQVRQLEGEVEDKLSRESQIRDRLRLILTKIDSIETELTSAGAME